MFFQLFEDIVDVLDPEMNITSDDEDDEFDSMADGLSESHTRMASGLDFNQTLQGTKPME